MKGFVFTFDAAVGMLIVVSMAALGCAVMSLNAPADMEGVMARRIGSDIVATLHYNGTLGTLDRDIIESGLNGLLPPNMAMGMTLHSRTGDVQINSEPAGSYYSGTWGFIRPSQAGDDMVFVEYKVGFKQVVG